MTRSDFEPFTAMLELLAEQYNRTLSPGLLRLYFDGLQHLDLDTVRGALNVHVRNTEVGQFWPKIADIERAAGGGADEQAFRALAELQDGFRTAGAWRSVVFADPIVARVVQDMGGWPELCSRDSEEWHNFGSKDFVRRYRAYRERGLPAGVAVDTKLLGNFDRVNLALGAPADDAIVIGTAPKRAQAIGTALPQADAGSATRAGFRRVAEHIRRS